MYEMEDVFYTCDAYTYTYVAKYVMFQKEACVVFVVSREAWWSVVLKKRAHIDVFFLFYCGPKQT